MIQETSDSEENPRKRVFCPLPSYTGHTFLLEMPSLLPGGRACRVRGLSSQGHINSAPRELVPGQRPLRLPIFSHLWKRSLPASSKLSSCQESEGNSHFLRSSSTRESTLGRRTRSREKGYRRGQGVLALLSWWHRLEPQRRPPPPYVQHVCLVCLHVARSGALVPVTVTPTLARRPWVDQPPGSLPGLVVVPWLVTSGSRAPAV